MVRNRTRRGINFGSTVNLNEPGTVRAINPNLPIEGQFGTVRTVQVDPSLPFQPTTSNELVDLIGTRNYAFGDRGGYANLPVRLNEQQQQNLITKLGDQIEGYETKFYTTPQGTQGFSWKAPKTFNEPGAYSDGTGYAAIDMRYRPDVELPISNADLVEVRRPLYLSPKDTGEQWNFGQRTPLDSQIDQLVQQGRISEQAGEFLYRQPRQTWGEYADSQLSSEVPRGMIMDREGLTTRQVLGSIQGDMTVGGERGKYGQYVAEQLMMGDQPMSISAQMAQPVYLDDRRAQGNQVIARVPYQVTQASSNPIVERAIPSTTMTPRAFTALPVRTWTDSPTQEFDLVSGTTYRPVDSPDAIASTWKQTPSQSAQMQQGDILRGIQGETDLRDLAPAMEPLYVSDRSYGNTFLGLQQPQRVQIANPVYASSAPMREMAYQVNRPITTKDGKVMNVWRPTLGTRDAYEALEYEGMARALPTRDVTETVLAPDPITRRIGEERDLSYLSGNVPTAFQRPETATAGGYDITALPQRNYGYEKDVKVMLPSTVLKDRGLSEYSLSLPSSINATQAGLDDAVTMGERLAYDAEKKRRGESTLLIDREGMDGYVYTKTGKTRSDEELADMAARGLTVDPELDRTRYTYSEPTMDAQGVRDRLATAQRQANAGYTNERNRVAMGRNPQQVSAAAMLDNAMRDSGISSELYAKLESARSRLGNMRGIDEVARKQDIRDEYGRRVAFTDNAISNAFSRIETPEQVMAPVPTRKTMVSRDGNIVSEVVPMTLQQQLAAVRRAQSMGFSQAQQAIPSREIDGMQMAQIQIGSENPYYITPKPGQEVRVDPDGFKRLYEGTKLKSDVYDLTPQQTQTLQQEMAQGLRNQMPIGSTNPNITYRNEFVRLGDSKGMGIPQQLPITLGARGTVPQTVIQVRQADPVETIDPISEAVAAYGAQDQARRAQAIAQRYSMAGQNTYRPLGYL